MKTVNFTEMKNGTKDEYLLLDEYEQKYIDGTADRILKFMSGLNSTLEGYKITRLEHSLQTATRAFKDNESKVHTIPLFNTTDLVNVSVTFPLTKIILLRYFSVAKVELALNSLIKFKELIVISVFIVE